MWLTPRESTCAYLVVCAYTAEMTWIGELLQHAGMFSSTLIVAAVTVFMQLLNSHYT